MHTYQAALTTLFGRCGEVTDVYNTGKGYAFVTMIDANAAQAAIRELNCAVIDGRVIKVSELVIRGRLERTRTDRYTLDLLS